MLANNSKLSDVILLICNNSSRLYDVMHDVFLTYNADKSAKHNSRAGTGGKPPGSHFVAHSE